MDKKQGAGQRHACPECGGQTHITNPLCGICQGNKDLQEVLGPRLIELAGAEKGVEISNIKAAARSHSVAFDLTVDGTTTYRDCVHYPTRKDRGYRFYRKVDHRSPYSYCDSLKGMVRAMRRDTKRCREHQAAWDRYHQARNARAEKMHAHYCLIAGKPTVEVNGAEISVGGNEQDGFALGVGRLNLDRARKVADAIKQALADS